MEAKGKQTGGTSVSVVVLAGGESSRLGRDKAFLTLGGQTLVERAVDRLSCLSDDIAVVANEMARYEALELPARLVSDERPGKGALMGIYSGLKRAYHPHALDIACDMPFLSLPLLHYMLRLVAGNDVVIPRLADGLEPLHAIYSKACLPAMARVLAMGQRRIVAFFDRVRVRYVKASEVDRFDPRYLSFVNVNTPQDWERVQQLAAEASPTSQ